MTLGDDYRGEMTRFARLSDEEIERLLDGSSTISEVADVASFLAEFRKGVTRQVDEATIAHYVQGAAAVAAAGADSINAGSLAQSFLTPGNVATPPERNTAVKIHSSKRRTVVVYRREDRGRRFVRLRTLGKHKANDRLCRTVGSFMVPIYRSRLCR